MSALRTVRSGAGPREPTVQSSESGVASLLPIIAALALTMIALGLRLSQLHQSLYGDELFTYDDIHGHGLVSVVRAVRTGGENSPPLFFLLAWVSAKLGDPTVWIRAPSILFSTATVPLVYALGRETVGRTAALIGATYVALSPFTLFYGVEARPYATMVLFVVLSTVALVKATATRSRWWWLLYGASATAAAYTHYTCAFVLAFQAIWSLWACRDRLREPLITNALVALAYLPWLIHVHGKQLNVLALFQPFGVSRVLGDVAKAAAGYPYASPREIPRVLGLVAIAGCVLVGLAGVAVRLRRPRSASPRSERHLRLMLIAGLAAASPIGELLYTLFVTDIFQPRGLLASLPAAALLLGALLAALPWRMTAITATIVSGVLLVATVRSVGDAYRRAPIKDVADYIDARSPADAVVIYYPYFGLLGTPAPALAHDLNLYVSRRLPITTLPTKQQLAELWRHSPRVISVGSTFRVRGTTGLFAATPPTSQHRPVLATRRFVGLVTYVVTLYGPPSRGR